MNQQTPYDVAIIGGGLAGLSTSIQLARNGFKIILFEKEKYPFHKVCGEYISMESWDFLESLGVPLRDMDIPLINRLMITSSQSKPFQTRLPMGGFGISRYALDHVLATIARKEGVDLMEGTRVEQVQQNGLFEVNFSTTTGKAVTQAKLICGSFGKRSNLDLKWRRSFVQQKPSAINNYIGVKYHIRINWQEDLIGLHNFKNGYCGISKVEDNKYCFCYLTTAQNLKDSQQSIEQLEVKVLSRNPFLKYLIDNAQRESAFPVTISQISFDQKTQTENNILLLGDAAGMITPLCGNGMSMALHSSKIACGLISRYLTDEMNMETLKKSYEQQWKKQFYSRLRTGRILQRFFGAELVSDLFVQTFRTFPFLAKPMIRQTHGSKF